MAVLFSIGANGGRFEKQPSGEYVNVGKATDAEIAGSGVVVRPVPNADEIGSIGGKTCVYSCVVDGTTRYVGITNNIKPRGQAHMRQKGIVIEKIDGLQNLSRADARAVERVLINLYGIETKKGSGTLINIINSISAI